METKNGEINMALNNYQNDCRFCLKSSENMLDLFTFTLQPNDCSLVDYIGRMTNLKLVKGEYLPNNMCSACTDAIKSSYSFAQLCVVSDEILKKEETRREFRKIEEEALLDENYSSMELQLEDHLEDDSLDGSLSVKCEEVILQVPPETAFDEFSDLSDSESDQADRETQVEKIELEKPIIQLKEKYKCDLCPMSFSNKMKFLGHQKVHDETKPFKCSVCFQSFSKEVYLRVHLISHATMKDKQFTCKICGKQFFYQYLLKQHEYKHSDKKPFPCSKCDKGCLTSESLRRHMKIHDENYRKKAYTCAICRKEFAYPSMLTEHIKLHTGEKPHLCSICGKGFRQSGALHFHQRIHTGHKPFKCDTCGQHFKSRSLLKVHMRKHTNERPFICESCGMAFRQSSDLKTHMRIHTGERPVLCTLCGQRMSTTGQLTVHLRSHTGEKPYKCETCRKAFTTKTMLRKHERIHTGEKPYVCTICDKAFNQSSTLKTHANGHSTKSANSINKNQGRVKVTKPRKRVSKDTATIKINVGDKEKGSTSVRTEFTVILPAPIPLLTSTE